MKALKMKFAGLVWMPLLFGACSADFTPGSQGVGQRCFAESDCVSGLVCSKDRICIPGAIYDSDGMDQGPDADSGPDMLPDPDMFPDLDMLPDPDIAPDIGPDPDFGNCSVNGEFVCFDSETIGFCEGGDIFPVESCGSNARCLNGACIPSEVECNLGGQDDFCIGERTRQVCRSAPDGTPFYDVEFCDDNEFCLEGFCLVEEPQCIPGDSFCVSARARDVCRVEDGQASFVRERCGREEECVDGQCFGPGDECFPGEQFCANERIREVCREGDDGRLVFQRLRCPNDTLCFEGECFFDEPMSCEVGDQQCITESTYEVCIPGPNGRSEYIPFDCPDNSTCEDGFCVQNCVDRDGDGAFANCPPFDCNDRLPEVSPFNMEVCGDSLDNDCNGQVNEGCGAGGCCTGMNACGPNQFCDDCQCVPFNPFMCTQSNQPCQNLDSFENNFYCIDLEGNGEGRCIGLCDFGFPDPSSTCPEPNTQQCVFGDPQGGVGLCFDECNTSTDCQAGPDTGCLRYDLGQNSMFSGVCVPAGPTPLGGSCNPDAFFACEGGAVCVDVDGVGIGTCMESCRPFVFTTGMGTDCSPGSFCTPYGEDFGVCLPDNGQQEFEACPSPGTTCSADGVACYPSPIGGNRCRRTCRLNSGNLDCGPMQECRDLNQGQSEVGVCAAIQP